MGLHDVSKDDSRRLAPKLNQSDQAMQRLAKGTTSANDVTADTGFDDQELIKYGFARYVKSDRAAIVSDGSTMTTLQVAHNLGYVPKVEAYLNDLENPEIPGTLLSMPLPTWTGLFIDTGADPQVQFDTWLYVAGADDTNVYFQLANSTGVALAYVITFYLYQQIAVPAA